MKTKIKKFGDKVKQFGGIYLIHELILSTRICSIIKEISGERSCNAEYEYSDLILTMMYITLSGGECAEDVKNVEAAFRGLRRVKVPSPDTILGMQEELEKATKKKEKRVGIKIDKARMDCGSYIKEVLEYLGKEGIKFYVRAKSSDNLLSKAAENEEWKEVKINNIIYEVTSFRYKFGEEEYRMISYRWPNESGQMNFITFDSKEYLFIITNDYTTEEKQIIEYYNHRGNSKRIFDILKNDFNWRKLPFSFIGKNTVYIIMMAICYVIYLWIIDKVSKAYGFLKNNIRLKKFTFWLISIPAKIVKTTRTQILNLYTSLDIEFEKLFVT